MTMATSFRIESTVRGHHIFKDTWTSHINEELAVQVEEGNVFNEHAVAVQNRDERVVGHLPREISRKCWFFLRKKHSKMTCKITGHRHLSKFRGKGLVVPCIYIFEGKQNHIEKLIAIFSKV